MKKVPILLSAFFVSFLLIVMVEAHANPIVILMIKAEKTGNKTQVPPPQEFGGEQEPLPWYYEIKVEWKAYGFSSPASLPALDLYRKSSPGAYPNGNIIAYNVRPHSSYGYWDSLCPCTRYGGNYLYYDWARAGTWYYMAEQDSNEESETVP